MNAVAVDRQDHADRASLILATQKLEASATAFERAVTELSKHHASGVSSVTINAGGVGILVCSVLAAFTAAAVLFLALFVVQRDMEHTQRINTLGDYIQAIYRDAPHLQQDDDRDHSQ